jgi:hypothetical protein
VFVLHFVSKNAILVAERFSAKRQPFNLHRPGNISRQPPHQQRYSYILNCCFPSSFVTPICPRTRKREEEREKERALPTRKASRRLICRRPSSQSLQPLTTPTLNLNDSSVKTFSNPSSLIMDPYSQTPARDPDSFYDPSYHNSFSHPASSHNSSHRASSHNSSHRASFHNPSYLASFHNSSDPASFTNSDNLQDLEAPTRSVQAQQALDDKLVEMNIDIPGWVDQSSNKISSGNVNSSMPTSLLGVTGGGNSELNTRFDEQDHDETAYSAFEMESSVAALDLHPPYDAAPTNTQYPFGSVQAASVSSPRNDKSIAQQNPPDNSSTYYPRNEWDARSCEWRNDVSVNGDREGYQTFCSESKAMGLAVSDYGQLRCHTTCYPRRNPGAPTRLDKNALHQLEPWSSLNKRDDPRMISQGTAVCYMCVCAYSKNSSRQWPSQKSTDPDLELSTENSSVDQVSNGLGESLATLKPPPASDQSNSSWNQSLIHSQSTNPQWTHVIDSPDRQLGLSDNRYPSIAQGSSSPYYFQATESSYADHPRSDAFALYVLVNC